MLICANLIEHAFTNSQIVRAEAGAIETPARHLRAFEAAARAKEAGLRKKRESLSDCSRLQALLSRLQRGETRTLPHAHHGACDRNCASTLAFSYHGEMLGIQAFSDTRPNGAGRHARADFERLDRWAHVRHSSLGARLLRTLNGAVGYPFDDAEELRLPPLTIAIAASATATTEFQYLKTI
ncbi:hypothetical protein NKI79_06650 [Mesorhizobium sp. M0340]|uniref:hypothetical protein n=1 Tax=Mesorhizobium sp. M0340 TaxID=2956939 RepID=UPI00333DDA78